MQSDKSLLSFKSNGSWACRCGSLRSLGECICSTLTSCPKFAVQRRFASEHAHLLDRQWAEDEEYDPKNAGTEGTTTPSECIDPDETSQSSVTTSATGTSRSRKRRRTEPHPLPIPLAFQKGHDFWTMVDKWFFARMRPDQLGTSWSSLGWAK